MKFKSSYGSEIKSPSNSNSSAYPVEDIHKSKYLPMIREKSFVSAQIKEETRFSGLDILQQNLNNCLKIIDDEVMKRYLTKLDKLPINAINQEEIEYLKDIQFFRISSLVYQEGEFSLYKLAAIFNSLINRPCTVVIR